MSYLSITKWTEYQHYRNPRPPWVKFYVHLLDDEQMRRQSVTTRLLWTHLLLLAARYGNAIPNDPEYIGKMIGIESEACREGFETLLKGRWLRQKQTPRTSRKKSRAEKEVETEKEVLSELKNETGFKLPAAVLQAVKEVG